MMKKLLTLLCGTLWIFLWGASPANGQSIDWRNAKNGHLISTNGYCDQPYVVILPDRTWLCVFTTGAGNEGTGGQHIVSCRSTDHGKTWSKPVAIEPSGTESASWAMPYLTRYGRVYVFYDYNGDKIHSLGDRKNIREDMLGWYCFKYSDDGGKSWSKRYRLPVRETSLDRNNDWQGKVQILWGIGKPIDVDQGMMFAFSKIGKYMLDGTEGWFFRCDNIHQEKDPDKLQWTLLPEGDHGIKNTALGPVNEEQNIVQLSNGTLYCMERTISGHPAESYSYDGGRTWTTPQVPVYLNGIALKNPRACPRIWKCHNGKYLFWYHNHGGWNFESRNPAWVSGGVEKDGKIVWSQPEILLYEDDVAKRMSYPDLVEQDGRYWVTQTNKAQARSTEIPSSFLNTLWSQFEIHSVAAQGLVGEWTQDQLGRGSRQQVNQADYKRGITLDLEISLTDLTPGQPIMSLEGSHGQSIRIETGTYGSVVVTLNDGTRKDSWNSDPGLIPAYGTHAVSVTLDNGPKIIQFIVDGVVCNGRNFRQYGWSRYEANMENFSAEYLQIGNLKTGQLQPTGKVTHLRIYNRPLMNTEVIGNQRNGGQ
jgi:hypothetical protein